MLQNRLSCAERTGNAECAALGDRQEGIDYPYLHYQGLVGSETLVVAAYSLLYWPAEDHGELSFIALGICDRGHVVPDIVCALFCNGLDCPVNVLESERKHYLVGENALRNGSEGIARSEDVSDLADRCELPVPVRDGVKIHSALEEEAALRGKRRQRVLKTVVNLCQKARTQLDAHELACELDFVAHLDSVCHLVDLHAGLASVDPDDLSLQKRVAYVYEGDFVLGDGSLEGNCDKVAVHSGYVSDCLCHMFHSIFNSF